MTLGNGVKYEVFSASCFKLFQVAAAFWGYRGASLSILGHLWTPWAPLGRSWGCRRRSWAANWRMYLIGRFGVSPRDQVHAVLGRSWAILWRSQGGRGAALAGLGLVLGDLEAVLGRSWAVLGAVLEPSWRNLHKFANRRKTNQEQILTSRWVYVET